MRSNCFGTDDRGGLDTALRLISEALSLGRYFAVVVLALGGFFAGRATVRGMSGGLILSNLGYLGEEEGVGVPVLLGICR